jgi:hypothetical protein
MSRSKTILLPLSFLLFSGTVAAIWRGQRPIEADAQTCAVYQSFYRQLPEKKAVFFERVSRSYAFFPGDRVPEPPRKFEKDTGEYEEIELIPDMEPVMRRVRVTFEQDTTEYFSAVAEGEERRISNCFYELDDAPGIYSGPFSVLHARETALGRDQLGFVTLWTVSPVGFSEDGQSAVMYVGQFCGGLCGWGGFILLENKNGAWVVVGDKGLWVS